MAEGALAKDFLKGIWKENPVFRLLLGMCPTLAVTTTAINGLGMGLATTFVLFCSSVVISFFRRLIPSQVRIATFIVIIATFVTMADLFLQAKYPILSKALGPYVPLIVVNCIILGRQEAFSSKHSSIRAMADALGMGLGFVSSLIILGSIRELIGHGTIFNYTIFHTVSQGGWFVPWVIMILPAGAFLTLGLLIGFFNTLSQKSS